MYIGHYNSFAIISRTNITYPIPPSGTICNKGHVYCCADITESVPYGSGTIKRRDCGCHCQMINKTPPPPKPNVTPRQPPVNKLSVTKPIQASGSARTGVSKGATGGQTIGYKGGNQTIEVGRGVGAGAGSFVRTGVELLPPAVQEALEPVVEGYEKIEDKIEGAGLPAWLLPAGIVGLGAVLVLVIVKK